MTSFLRIIPDFRHWAVWVGGFALALGFALFRLHGAPEVDHASSAPPGDAWGLGYQLVAVVVVSETCGFSRQPEVMAGIPRVLESLALFARGRGEHFVGIGVAIGPIARDGSQFLQEIYNFDEMISGGGWLGTAALRYLWQDFPGEPNVPQIVVMRREMQRETASPEDKYLRYYVDNEQVLQRLIGTRSIATFDIAELYRILGDGK